MAEQLRDCALSCLKSNTHMDAKEKLALLRYFLEAFCRTRDTESQLVLRYEILSLCESTCSADLETKVDLHDWISFAEDCLAAGFLSNAIKAYERVITHIQLCQSANSEQGHGLGSTLKYLKHRIMGDVTAQISMQSFSCNDLDSQHEIPKTAASQYMVGIRKKERAKLQILQARNK